MSAAVRSKAAGDVDVLLLDKTGTITLGNRQATASPVSGRPEKELAEAAQLPHWPTKHRRPQHRRARKTKIRNPGPELHRDAEREVRSIFAHTRMSGVDHIGDSHRKGAAGAIRDWVGGRLPPEIEQEVESISNNGGTPLVVAMKQKALGVIYLKDIVKGGLSDRFERFRAIGIRTVMITGDNALTAAAIAKEAGMMISHAAKPEDNAFTARNRNRAPRGNDRNGTNDAPALAQADVGYNEQA
jgi:K+-transporting ATPase ATPase B chain